MACSNLCSVTDLSTACDTRHTEVRYQLFCRFHITFCDIEEKVWTRENASLFLQWQHLVLCSLTMKHTRMVSTKCTPGFACRAVSNTTLVPSVPAFIIHANLRCKKYIHLCCEICVWFHAKVGNWFFSLYQVDWRNLMKQSVTIGAQLLWGGSYGCNNGRYGCSIVMSYIEMNKAVSQWLLTYDLCVSVNWPLTCAFQIPCTYTPEIIDMHRGVCDNFLGKLWWVDTKESHAKLCAIFGMGN